MTKEYIIKENSGTAFRNKLRDNPNAPHYTGTVNIEGKELRIAMWAKATSRGDDMFSIKFSELMAKPKTEPKEPVESVEIRKDEVESDDNIPF